MDDAHRPDASGPSDSVTPRSGPPADRRSFLRGVAALAAGAAGGALLGESLLVRGVQAQPGPFPFVELTHSGSYTVSSSGTIPRTETRTGTRPTAPGDPPTFTETLVRPPTSVSPYTIATVFPAPGGGTQPVTIAGTRTLSYTPPLTATQTYSMRGESYTLTLSRDPTFWTATVSNSYSFTCLGSDEGDDGNGGGMPGGDALVLQLAGADLETVDADSIALFDPLRRHGDPLRLRFAGETAR